MAGKDIRDYKYLTVQGRCNCGTSAEACMTIRKDFSVSKAEFNRVKKLIKCNICDKTYSTLDRLETNCQWGTDKVKSYSALRYLEGVASIRL